MKKKFGRGIGALSAAGKTLLFVLCAVLVLTLAPRPAQAATTLAVGDYIYFGTDGDIPILWKVTATDGSTTASLQSVYTIGGASQYHKTAAVTIVPELTFATSDLYADLQGYFKNAYFNDTEQGKITAITLPTTSVGSTTNREGIEGIDGHYWLGTEPFQTEWNGQFWWSATFVDDSGDIDFGVVIYSWGVRPALNLNLDSVLLQSVPAVTSASSANTGGHKQGQATGGLDVSFAADAPQTGDTITVELLDGGGTAKLTKSGIAAAAAGTASFTQQEINGLAAGEYKYRTTLKNDLGLPLAQRTSAATDYTVLPLSAECKMTSFTLAGAAGTINETAGTVAVTVPRGTDITSIAPTVAVSALATVSPASGVAQSFTNSVTYTVTAEDGATTKDYVVTVTAGSAAPGPGRPDPAYTHQTLTDKATGVTLSGWFTEGTSLVVTPKALHEKGACDACDEIRAAGSWVSLYDVMIIGGSHNGNMELTLPVPSGYNGQQMQVWHCKRSHVEKLTGTVRNNAVTITVSSLSPFGVTKLYTGLGIPKTGDGSNLGLWTAMLAISLLTGGFAVVQLVRKRRALSCR